MRSASSLGDLVKINEDGTLETALSFVSSDYNSWKPTVSFISVGSDKSVYICFSSMYQSWDDTTIDPECVSVQFVRVYPDNHFDILWPLNPKSYSYETDGQVCTWTWEGMDSDPLQKGDDGQLYFKVQTYTSNSTSDSIYSYDPTVGGKPVLRTPANGNLSIDSFKIDSQNHLFIKSASYNNSSSYMRYYTQGITAPGTIYYSSDSSLWVRGYTPNKSGNALILNGYGINGMSGIIRANLQTTGNPTFDLLYSSDMSYNYIQLFQSGYGGSTCPTSIVKENPIGFYSWDSSVVTAGSLDKAKLLARIAPLYYGTPTISDENFNLLKSVTDLNVSQTAINEIQNANGDIVSSLVKDQPLYYIISNYPNGFLRRYFGGQFMADWFSSKGLTNFDIGNVANLIWGADGSLYGIYNSSCYFASSDNSTYVLKLLDSAGNKALNIVSLVNGKCKPSKIKIVGDYLYYRYSVMNGTNETGFHKLARFNISTSKEEEVFTDSSLSGKNVELLSYDVSSDNSTMYISALDYATNAVIFGKINLATKQFAQIPANTSYGTIRTF